MSVPAKSPPWPTDRGIDAAEVAMFLRLKIKLAEVVNGVDLSHCAEGDVIDLPEPQATMLIAEGWADRVAPDEIGSHYLKPAERAIAADAKRKPKP